MSPRSVMARRLFPFLSENENDVLPLPVRLPVRLVVTCPSSRFPFRYSSRVISFRSPFRYRPVVPSSRRAVVPFCRRRLAVPFSCRPVVRSSPVSVRAVGRGVRFSVREAGREAGRAHRFR